MIPVVVPVSLEMVDHPDPAHPVLHAGGGHGPPLLVLCAAEYTRV